ncbi:MAG: PDZ domain-containing protein, partial [Alphaproteobacteria bacterium]|nr:PDZ domain-containing protein [Alphaproteobacteria bacterium]
MKRFFVFFIAIMISGYNATANNKKLETKKVDNAPKGMVMTYDELQDAYKQLEKFEAVLSLVKQRYVDEKTYKEIIDLSLDGMLKSLDPHSSFLDEKELEDMQVSTSGKFGGLGIQITTEDEVVKVVSPIDDTPAQKAGIMSGDFITHLDGEAIIGI